MDVALVSEVLIKRGKKVCTSKDIAGFGGSYLALLSRMINSRWLLPIKRFRGVYYVFDYEERARRFRKLDSFEILVRVLNAVLGREWYFGRVTALSLSGLIDQPSSVYYVFNKKFSKTIESNIFGKIVFVKTAAEIAASCGLETKKHQGAEYTLCTTARHFADCVYACVHGHADKEQAREFYARYPVPDATLLRMLLKCYPKRSAVRMLAVAREVSK